ncbi:MAG TPA: YihY/virulence factor BrkB family protein [Actinomycetota bacterium]|nr:YihY/virulence factor BrkB family protein [Actinomycetota bacterium]
MQAIQDVSRRVDTIQKQKDFLGFVIGVVKKFGDDQAGYLAALVAYYAFFSLFPLLLVFTTVLGFFLQHDLKRQASIIHTVRNNFPGLGESLQIGHLRGSGLGLVIGLVFALLAGIGVVQALQYAMDEVWGVPKRRRPNFFISRLRAVIMLAILGVAMVAATAVSNLPFGFLGSLLLNIGIVVVAFKVLTVADITWLDVLPGALVAGASLTLLQTFGGLLVRHTLKNANATYGTFAVVIGLLSFIYLGAQITIYAAEINVVKKKHLWPRSLVDAPTPGDEEVFRQRAKIEQRRPDENIRVSFDKSPRTG